MRVQEMLNALELRLGIPESAYPALVFYQLRRLWQTGREIIEQFVADLVRQQEERERRQHLAEHNRKQFAQREARRKTSCVALRLQPRTRARQRARERTRASHAVLALLQTPRRWTNVSAGRSPACSRARTRAQRGAREVFDALDKEPLPEFPGLTVEARRAINIDAIAYAEVLCLRLAKTQLVKLAREATARREVTDDYGTREECEPLMEEIDQRARRSSRPRQYRPGVKARSERIKQIARYRSPADTSPMSDSVAFSEGDIWSRGNRRRRRTHAQCPRPRTPGTCSGSCCVRSCGLALTEPAPRFLPAARLEVRKRRRRLLPMTRRPACGFLLRRLRGARPSRCPP